MPVAPFQALQSEWDFRNSRNQAEDHQQDRKHRQRLHRRKHRPRSRKSTAAADTRPARERLRPPKCYLFPQFCSIGQQRMSCRIRFRCLTTCAKDNHSGMSPLPGQFRQTQMDWQKRTACAGNPSPDMRLYRRRPNMWDQFSPVGCTDSELTRSSRSSLSRMRKRALRQSKGPLLAGHQAIAIRDSTGKP
jgi:hypothetical protein